MKQKDDMSSKFYNSFHFIVNLDVSLDTFHPHIVSYLW